MEIEEGRRRVIIEGVKPEIGGGRFPVKRTVGESVSVEADVFADGSDAVSAALLWRKEDASEWMEAPMMFLVNDRWQGSFRVEDMGRYLYTLRAWVDRFTSWRRNLEAKSIAGQDRHVDFLEGAELVEEAGNRADGPEAKRLLDWARMLRARGDREKRIRLALDSRLAAVMARFPDRDRSTMYKKRLPVTVDRPKARFSTWYEMFPRSCASRPGKHGTFRDCEERLPYVAHMGFDVLYLPPIHPIGYTNRKGKNNTPSANPDDPGSPWAIGSKEGGHKSIHPELGTLEDFKRFIEKAASYGMEVALDLAFQCSPDHPYVHEHPEWFRWRPDRTVKHAENPPKKYEDIYPLDFDTENWIGLFEELKSVVLFWIDQGVRIFRVDNPHTKPFVFWEWLIEEVKDTYPEVIFLSEAFTRPKVMYRLAKAGFTQSYTYFAWRNSSPEIEEYFKELTRTELKDFFRPNLWPNTPDILPEYLQAGGRPGFMARLVLAATLGPSYGIYGPAFELCEAGAKEFGSEEYVNSEKYEIKDWDLESPISLKDFIARVNRIRRENAALQGDANLQFHPSSNERLLCFTKHTEDLDNIIFVVVNLDPHHTHSGWVELPLEDLGLDRRAPYQVHDLLGDGRYLWHASLNYLELNPHVSPAHIFRIRRRVRTERDFDYFM